MEVVHDCARANRKPGAADGFVKKINGDAKHRLLFAPPFDRSSKKFHDGRDLGSKGGHPLGFLENADMREFLSQASQGIRDASEREHRIIAGGFSPA
jgi:hypothetical protein